MKNQKDSYKKFTVESISQQRICYLLIRAVKALIFFNALTQCVNFLMH